MWKRTVCIKRTRLDFFLRMILLGSHEFQLAVFINFCELELLISVVTFGSQDSVQIPINPKFILYFKKSRRLQSIDSQNLSRKIKFLQTQPYSHFPFVTRNLVIRLQREI